jgi:hypothetical protein
VRFDAAPPRCVAANARAGQGLRSARALDDGTLAFTLCADEGATVHEAVCSSWRVDTNAGTFTAVELGLQLRTEPSPAAMLPPGATARGTPAGAEVCGPGEAPCRAVRFPTDGVGALLPTADGTLLAVRRSTPEGSVPFDGVETWDVVTGRLLARFTVHSDAYGDAVEDPQVLGTSLWTHQCAAGPACEGRLVDLRTGRVLARPNINGYNDRVVHVAGRVWAFVDGNLGAVEYLDVGTGRRARPRWDLGRGSAFEAALLPGPGATLRVVYTGDEENPVAGDVARLDLATRTLVGRWTPPLCPRVAAAP